MIHQAANRNRNRLIDIAEPLDIVIVYYLLIRSKINYSTYVYISTPSLLDMDYNG